MAAELHGLVEISNEDYHAGPGISKSHLDVIARSPFHYWAKYIDPNREPTLPTPAMILGSATHAAILEPDLFPKQYVAMPEGLDRRTKAGKEAYEDLMESGRVVLSAADYASCIAMRDAVHKHPTAGPLLTNGAAEQAYYVTAKVEVIDHETGEVVEVEELLKCKPDYLTGNGLIVDLKTTDDASPSGFAKSVANFRYDVQHAFYVDIFERLYGEPPGFFFFVAVEKTYPHAVAVYFIENDDVAFGRRRYMKDLQRLVECKRASEWPAYSSEIEPLVLPKWYRTAAE